MRFHRGRMAKSKSNFDDLIGGCGCLIICVSLVAAVMAATFEKFGILGILIGIVIILIIGWLGSDDNIIIDSNVDNMSGHDFENYIGKLFKKNGYRVNVTKGSGDYGVDIIAKKGDHKIAIQTKRRKSKVSRTAVSDAVGGMKHYQCNKSMVVTNNYFTEGAKKLAKSNNCDLVDRKDLERLIKQNSKK